MAELQAPHDAFKQFNGLIHRLPVFIGDRLDVDSYHLTFLDQQGQPLNDDTEVPAFLNQLSTLLPSINERQKTLLTMPQAWRAALCQQTFPGLQLTLDVNGHAVPEQHRAPLTFADHANAHEPDPQTQLLLININHYRPEQLLRQLPIWREHHKQLCATHINGFEQLRFCQQTEFDLLQGRFYTLPSLPSTQKLPPSAQSLMQLLVRLQEPEVDPEALAVIINQDVTLSYKLLRLINSAFFALPRQVSSIKQAVVMLGLNKIKTWASLLCLSGMDHKPNELRHTALIRARMCELLAPFYGGQRDEFFAAGLFSTLNALMDKPLADILVDLPLSEALYHALLHQEGAIGQALSDVLFYEQGNWAALADSAIPAEQLRNAYLDAIAWSRMLNTQLND